jgi:selenocysteine lyase/cysteine desulfurase
VVIDAPLFQPREMLTQFSDALQQGADAVICTHVSNVFGYILPLQEIADLCKKRGIPLIVDASQSAGILPVKLNELGAAFIAMPGHKGLYGPQGTGLLLCARDAMPVIEGGTGSQSRRQEMPEELPDRLESGTPNVCGICGLKAGVEFVQKMGRHNICKHEMDLLQYVYDRLSECAAIRLYTPRPQLGYTAPVLSVNVGDIPSETVSAALDEHHIAVRAGLHCAPSAHRRFGTLEQGTVRLAPSVFSNRDEAEHICKVFLQIAEKTLH